MNTTELRNKILNIATAEIGNTEIPAGSNKTKYGLWYEQGKYNGLPWCAIFVSWCYKTAGAVMGKVDDNDGYRHCASSYNFWRRNNRLTKTPQPGDVVLFDWNHDKFGDHTGIFVRWIEPNISFETIEGNTSSKDYSNGGQVLRCTRYIQQVLAFANVLDPAPAKTIYELGDTGAAVVRIQQALNRNRSSKNRIMVDGDFGLKTKQAVEEFQRLQHIAVDGVVGPITAKYLQIV